MSTTIASLLVKMGVQVEDAKKAEDELDKVKDAAKNVDEEGGGGLRNFGVTAGKAFAAAGAAALAASVAIFKLVDSVTSANDEIIKQAKVAGISTEAYQRLSFAAKISGTNIKSLTIASKTVALGLSDAVTKGTGPMVEGLELVGLRIEDVIGLPFEEQLGVFADAISGLGTESEKLAASQKLLGSRAGPQLATLLAEGAEGIRKLGDEAVIVSEQSLVTSANFQDSIVRLKDTVGGFVNEIGVELAPIVQDIIEDIKEWSKANGELIAKDIKNFLRSAIPVIKALATAVGFIVGAIKDFIDLMGGWKSAMGVAVTATLAFKLALAGTLGPIGAIGLAIGALVSVVAGLVNQFDDVNDALSETEKRAGRLRKFQRGGKFANEGLGKKIFTAQGDVERLEELAEAESLTPAQRRVAVSLARSSQDELERLKADNSRLLREKGGRDQDRVAAAAATKKSKADQRARIDASVEVKKKFKGKKGERLSKDLLLGRISVDEALGGSKKRKRGGGGRAAAAEKEPESDVTLAESLLAIRTGTADPRQLKQVIQQLARKTPAAKSIKPTVAITFFNFNFNQTFKGGNPASMQTEAMKAARSEFGLETAKAGQQIPSTVLR